MDINVVLGEHDDVNALLRRSYDLNVLIHGIPLIVTLDVYGENRIGVASAELTLVPMLVCHPELAELGIASADLVPHIEKFLGEIESDIGVAVDIRGVFVKTVHPVESDLGIATEAKLVKTVIVSQESPANIGVRDELSEWHGTLLRDLDPRILADLDPHTLAELDALVIEPGHLHMQKFPKLEVAEIGVDGATEIALASSVLFNMDAGNGIGVGTDCGNLHTQKWATPAGENTVGVGIDAVAHVVRPRRLYEMDNLPLSEFDELLLYDVDYIEE